MNAYELADEFDWMTEEKIVQWCNDVVNMLRQQADRIAELEKLVHQRFDDGKRLGVIETEDRLKQQSAEPFIWLKQDFDGEWIEVHPNKGIPLYTTPQIKELSDEEIYELWCESDNTELLPEMRNKDGSINYIILTFSQLLLDKASEK